MSKYGNRKVTLWGQTFDSKRECLRWQELKLMEKAGKIYDLRRQVRFELIPEQRLADTLGPKGGRRKGKLLEKAVFYVADFVYYEGGKPSEGGKLVVEDAKGCRTREYIIKRKLMLARYGIQIREV
jgi:hypothetical protein